MAAYAALISLMNTMERIQNYPRLSAFLDKKQIESLGEMVGCFLHFLENYNSQANSKESEHLERQIARLARAAEDVIESHVAEQIFPRPAVDDGKISSILLIHLKKHIGLMVDKFQQLVLAGSNEKSSIFLLDLQKVLKDMDSIKKRIAKIEKKGGFKDKQPAYSVHAASSGTLNTGKSTMVGFDDELIKLMEVLTGQESSVLVVSIVGMGGSGKTTLARNVFENLYVTQHFDIRAWATISQGFNVREIILGLLSLQGKSTNETVDILGQKLYQSLFGRRYLIVLDDIWNTEVWDKIKFFFPDNGCRSRVVLTTRMSNVAVALSSFYIQLEFLDMYCSWKLFCENAFGDGDCPPELVQIGKTIARLCRGLPLSICVIGGLLRNSHKTIEYWEDVAENINLILSSGENEQSCDVLFMSYSHLPTHLKPCFLSMGAFLEDAHIRVSRLIPLWVAMGFLKPNGAEIMEDVAEGYLKDLVDRNLILASWSVNGKIETCHVHDLLRDLCLRIAEKEEFFRVERESSIPEGIDAERLVCHELKQYKCRVFIPFRRFGASEERLLSILDGSTSEDILQYVNLRCIACILPRATNIFMLSSSIILFWNLQMLIIEGFYDQLIVAPLEIWKMPQLRHVECSKIYLPDPPPRDDCAILGSLLTLKKVVNFRLSEEAYKRIPNIKKLHIICSDKWQGYNDLLCGSLSNLHHLSKLESLNMDFSFPQPPLPVNFPKINPTFPKSLTKLSLTNCRLNWKHLSRIGSLPELEILRLGANSVVGNEWSPIDGGFPRLKLLSISYCDLSYWKAESSHFPVLEKLVIEGLDILDEIPLDFGEIPTLKLIHLRYCSESAAISVMKIKEEQETWGNDGLQIQVIHCRISSKLFATFHQAGNMWSRCKRAESF